jgi:hypothetical protein
VLEGVVVLVVCADATPSASAKTDIGNKSLFIVFGSLKKGQSGCPASPLNLISYCFKDSMEMTGLSLSQPKAWRAMT